LNKAEIMRRPVFAVKTNPKQQRQYMYEKHLSDIYFIIIMKKNESNFECSICMDVAKEPVVTKCGHLFCWPCIYDVNLNYLNVSGWKQKKITLSALYAKIRFPKKI
jgi:hypothetical protein